MGSAFALARGNVPANPQGYAMRVSRNPAADMDQTAFLDALAAYVGPSHVLVGSDAAPFCTDWRGLFSGQALAVLRPADTTQVAACVGLCAAQGVAVVPQGGNTGLCGGATPGDEQIVLCVGRLNRLRDLDTTDMVMVAEAGMTLQAAREVAAEAGLALPLSIGSEGTAQLGGVLATNAGGTATLRHGNARDLVLGLEMVLADGRIWNGLRRLRKDNTGYALRQLFVGAEGTLGIITAASLRLVPAARRVEVALAAVVSPVAALSLLYLLNRAGGAVLSAYEYISGPALQMTLAHIEGLTDPLSAPAPHYVLIEFSAPREDAPLRAQLEAVLAEAMDSDLVTDAVLAASDTQRAALWRLRDSQTEAQQRAGATVKNDISVPLSRIPALIDQASGACRALVPGVRIVPFGHLGDGNIHFNLVQPEGADATLFLAQADALMHAVSKVARALGGSFSAEHGIGQLKTGLLEEWRGGVEMDMMRAIKHALDPLGILNPGKVL
jgi:FAD/FMN-containing dehydrogenase